MATLVLSTVGGAIGGPIGAALGAVLGQAVDSRLLAPKGRQGPRLAELAVQTSSYGTQIPKLFGRMRVAGTVIWATDLLETRSSSGGGKGRPSTTNYSYAASFAVLLSARAIRGVGRIWADGKLLRGEAGDWKATTGFRLHLGGEDQAVDPLIASAEGIGAAPAHRGSAYAVFEQLQLADFGNRIPSLTFEVIADDTGVTTGSIVAALSDGAVEGAAATLAVDGFAAGGDAVRGVAELLARADGSWFTAAGGRLAMRRDTLSTIEVVDKGFSAGGEAGRRRACEPIEVVPRTLALVHYDPARDYQTGVQRARRPGPGRRDERVEMPAALDAAAAKTMAEDMLARAEAGRRRRTVTLGPAALALAPGTAVSIAGEDGMWRIAEAAVEGMAVSLTLVPVAPGVLPASASPGRVLGAPDLVVGTTILHAAELPPLDDAVLDTPRLTVVAAGTGAGWRSAALLYSLDEGASWQAAGGTAAPACVGTIVVAPGTGPATLIDARGTAEVELATDAMTLFQVGDAALDAGANLALVGDELVQFGQAERLGGRRWRLSRLLRGRRGTEAAAGAQGAGDRFVLIEPAAARTIDLPLAALGSRVRIIASGVGDAAPVETSAVIAGASVLPPTPVRLTVSERGDGTARIDWVRRSRAGWRWLDGGDAPLGEDAERYQVLAVSADGGSRLVETDAPAFVVEASERAGGAVVTVRQQGRNGLSPGASVTVPAG